jgi:hypothetical protein
VRRSLLLGFAGFGLLAQVPAILIAGVLEDACRGHCRLAGAEGTLWAGRASVYLRSRDGAPWQAVGPLSWKIGWTGVQAWLLGGQVSAAAAPEGIRVAAARLGLPAGVALPFLPGAPLAGWGGDLELAEMGGVWSWKSGWQAQGVLRWRQAQTAVLPDLVLGDYRLQFQRGEDGGAGLQLRTDTGCLVLEGTGVLPPGGSWRVELDAQPAGAERMAIEPVLRGMGRPLAGGDGLYRIVWQAP